jgi:quercetin dioxygenase-like cupin family protein
MTMLSSDKSGNMIGELAQFDLVGEMADSERKKPWQHGLYAKTLFKKQDFRTVLISMEVAARMKEHHADGTVSVQVLKGRIRVGVEGKVYDLPAGNLLTLGASIKHEVESMEDSAFLLTISWPSNQELLAMEHRGYGT